MLDTLKPVNPIVYELIYRSSPIGDDRDSTGKCFDDDQSERLVP